MILTPARCAFDPSSSLSAVQWSAFEGMEFTVRIAATYSRGALVYDGARVVNHAGAGRFLRPHRGGRPAATHRNLFAASQAGLVNNLNDGMSWGIFPLFFSGLGLGVERIGILKAVYPVVWGVFQVVTGPLSDRWGRKSLIVA